jgi:hypothetical protein
MRKSSILVLALIIVFLTATTASALRCGNTFIRTGLTTAEVLMSCGEPKLKEDLGNKGRTGKKMVRWVYGPHQGQMYYLTFVAGVLEEIESRKP